MGKEVQPIIKQQPSTTAKRQKFDKAFKLHAVSLLKAGQKPATQLALELGIRRNLLYKWADTLARIGRVATRRNQLNFASHHHSPSKE